jgi:hypothetical protein
VLTVLLPVLGACALQLDGQTLSDYGSHIVNAAKLGSTIFPIMFARLSFGDNEISCFVACGKGHQLRSKQSGFPEN